MKEKAMSITSTILAIAICVTCAALLVTKVIIPKAEEKEAIRMQEEELQRRVAEVQDADPLAVGVVRCKKCGKGWYCDLSYAKRIDLKYSQGVEPKKVDILVDECPMGGCKDVDSN